MAFQAINLFAGGGFIVLEVDDIGVAVDAGEILVSFLEETAGRVMHLGAGRIAWWRPVGVFMALHTGCRIIQILILGKSWCSKTESQQRNERCKLYGLEY